MTNQKAQARPSYRRTTLADVAREAGVAIATVSGILNERADCYASKETRQRVRAVARKLHYRPNAMARALVGKRTNTIGLVIPGLDVEMTSLKAAGFEAAARDAGCMALIACDRNEPDQEDRALRWLQDRYVDGIAIYPTETGDHTELRELAASNFPVVTFDAGDRFDLPTDDVTVDHFAGGMAAARHAMSVGCRRFAIANSTPCCHVNQRKIAGMEAELANAGLPAPRRMDLRLDRYSYCHWQTDELEQIRGFLKQHAGELDGVLAVGDVIGMAAVRIAIELGIRVPDELAVIGYDGMVLAGESAVPLSSIGHDSHATGRRAFELLSARINDPSVESNPLQRILMPPTVFARATTARKAAAASPIRPAPLSA